MIELRWEVWGTTATVLVDAASPGTAEAARFAVLRELGRIDRACSRFRRDSELARVNRAAGRPVTVSDAFLEALSASLRAAALTGGAVDPTVGEALRICGYDRDFDLLAAAEPTDVRVRVRVDAGRPPDWRAVAITGRTVAVAPPHTLDLGATAKALAADRSARSVHRETGAAVLVNLGGDIAVAGRAPDGGWRVRVTDDHRDAGAGTGQTVAIHAGGLATSSTTARRWRRGGRELHHIIDPRTGQPAAGDWRTVSVAAASCVDANTASTAAVVYGPAAAGWLRERRLPARLVSRAGAVQALCGWPGDDGPC